MSGVKRALQLAAVVVSAAVLVTVAWPRPAVDIRIPQGGIARIHKSFGRVTALPETIVVSAGGRPRVRIINADSVAHRLGLFSADAGATAEYTLPQPGTYTGACSAHATSETLTFVVR